MALRKLLGSKPETPYAKLPPLHVVVLKLKDAPKVVAWDFKDTHVTPTCTKQNKIAVLSDGHSLTKITLYEAMASKVQEGHSYFMRGWTVTGSSAPYTLAVGTATQFFRGSDIYCSEDLHNRAETLLDPSTPLVDLRHCQQQQGLMSVQGEVAEVSSIRKVQSGRDAVPVKSIVLQQDNIKVTLSLWREAAMQPINVGEVLEVSHVKGRTTQYGIQMGTTNFTRIQKQQTLQQLTILGVLTKDDVPSCSTTPADTIIEVLLVTGSTLQIPETLWDPAFDDLILQAPLNVTAKVEGKLITSIKLI
ncbi:uncharacterized protein LOC113030538 [Xyrichtys novacula]|uniref:Uncharacterized protein LOC113030538 n=1 Tax=Xyrichtys novacula TaxID=13765 RepID=A0AAV1FAI9_XYRNO|nr:uncharacterized protein LOC113030538 [Xyrichtys novacula]CAJ1057752.1 uncharacterized protein LOC113030538 [Xyrichtys novacula]